MILAALLACESTPEPERLPVRHLVAQPCAVQFDGTVLCWGSDTWELETPYEIEAIPRDIVSLQSEIPGILRGLRLDGTPEMLVCTLPFCSLPDQPLSVLTDWGGLSRSGALVLNDHTWTGPLDGGPYRLAASQAPVVLTESNVVHTRMNRQWRALSMSFRGTPTHLVGDVRPEGYTACVLDDTGAVQCVGDGPQPVFPGTYVDLAGSHGAICAQDTEDVVHCNDGTEHELGPILHLAAARYPYVDPDTGEYVSFRDAAVSVCGYDDVRVRCAGPRYPADVQAALVR